MAFLIKFDTSLWPLGRQQRKMQDERNPGVLGGRKQVPKTLSNTVLQSIFTICVETLQNKGQMKCFGHKMDAGPVNPIEHVVCVSLHGLS